MLSFSARDRMYKDEEIKEGLQAIIWRVREGIAKAIEEHNQCGESVDPRSLLSLMELYGAAPMPQSALQAEAP